MGFVGYTDVKQVVPSRPVPYRGGIVISWVQVGPSHGLRSPKGRSNPVPPMSTVLYKPSRGLNVKGVHKDVSRHCMLLHYVKIREDMNLLLELKTKFYIYCYCSWFFFGFWSSWSSSTYILNAVIQIHSLVEWELISTAC